MKSIAKEIGHFTWHGNPSSKIPSEIKSLQGKLFYASINVQNLRVCVTIFFSSKGYVSRCLDLKWENQRWTDGNISWITGQEKRKKDKLYIFRKPAGTSTSSLNYFFGYNKWKNYLRTFAPKTSHVESAQGPIYIINTNKKGESREKATV